MDKDEIKVNALYLSCVNNALEVHLEFCTFRLVFITHYLIFMLRSASSARLALKKKLSVKNLRTW